MATLPNPTKRLQTWCFPAISMVTSPGLASVIPNSEPRYSCIFQVDTGDNLDLGVTRDFGHARWSGVTGPVGKQNVDVLLEQTFEKMSSYCKNCTPEFSDEYGAPQTRMPYLQSVTHLRYPTIMISKSSNFDNIPENSPRLCSFPLKSRVSASSDWEAFCS